MVFASWSPETVLNCCSKSRVWPNTGSPHVENTNLPFSISFLYQKAEFAIILFYVVVANVSIKKLDQKLSKTDELPRTTTDNHKSYKGIYHISFY